MRTIPFFSCPLLELQGQQINNNLFLFPANYPLHHHFPRHLPDTIPLKQLYIYNSILISISTYPGFPNATLSIPCHGSRGAAPLQRKYSLANRLRLRDGLLHHRDAGRQIKKAELSIDAWQDCTQHAEGRLQVRGPSLSQAWRSLICVTILPIGG